MNSHHLVLSENNGFFTSIPNEIMVNWIATKLSYKESVNLAITNKSMYNFFQYLPDWSSTVINIVDTTNQANLLKPTSLEKIITNNCKYKTTLGGTGLGFCLGYGGTLLLNITLRVEDVWFYALPILGGAAGSLIGYGYAKLGLFARQTVEDRGEAESLLRSNIQERENDFVVKSVPS